MGPITVKVVDEEGSPLYFARVTFEARVIQPRFATEEALTGCATPVGVIAPHSAVGRVVGVQADVVELAARADRNGVARLSERPAPRALGVLGPLYILLKAADPQNLTPYVDWVLTEGRLPLRVEETGYVPQLVSVRPGQEVRVVLACVKGPTLRGRALDSHGRPLDQALVEVRDDEGGPVVATGHTDEEGHFIIAVPRAWRFVVTVHLDTPALEAGERPVTVPLGTDLEADVRTLPAAAMLPTESAALMIEPSGAIAGRAK